MNCRRIPILLIWGATLLLWCGKKSHVEAHVKKIEKSPHAEAAVAAAPNTTVHKGDAEVPKPSVIRPLNSEILPRLLSLRHVATPDTFKAIVIEIVPDGEGGFIYHPMDFAQTSKDRDNWWPASTVKLYAAVAALEKLFALNFDPLKTELTFRYEEGPKTAKFEDILRRAITDSRNPDFDKLVEIVGAGPLNRKFLTPRHGIHDTVMLRCYSGRTPNPETEKCTNRTSPQVLIRQGKREETLPIRSFTETEGLVCENEGNCTTLADLTEVMRRVMMHQSLPDEERFRWSDRERALLLDAMKVRPGHKPSGVVDGILEVFGNRPIVLHHKAGYADGWFSDNVFLEIKDTREQWIIGMANRPGRGALDEASRAVASLIADRILYKERKQAFKDPSTSAP